MPPRNGTEATPYRSITEGIRALRRLRENNALHNQTLTLEIRAGIYSPLLTQEVFPLDLSGLSRLLLRGLTADVPAGGEPQGVVIDAGFTGDILFLVSSSDITIEGFELRHGAHGLFMRDVTGITVRQNAIVENVFAGVSLGLDARANRFEANRIVANGRDGMFVRGTPVELIRNTMTDNGGNGLELQLTPVFARIHDNTISGNANGIEMRARALAQIDGGHIAANRGNGIILVEFSTAQIGCGEQPLALTGNSDAGIRVSNDGSTVSIDRSQIVFGDNGGGDIVGLEAQILRCPQ